MVLQGEIYKIKCPYCKTVTEANRLAPHAIKLKCLSCNHWVEEEAIISFARGSMFDEEEEVCAERA